MMLYLIMDYYLSSEHYCPTYRIYCAILCEYSVHIILSRWTTTLNNSDVLLNTPERIFKVTVCNIIIYKIYIAPYITR